MYPRRQNDQTLRDIQFEEMRRQIQQLQKTVDARQALLEAKHRQAIASSCKSRYSQKQPSKKTQPSSFRNPFHTQKTQTTQLTTPNEAQTPPFQPHSSNKTSVTKNTPPVPSKSKANLQCVKCKGYGHIDSDCPNHRVITIFEGEEYELSDEESDEEVAPAMYDEEPIYDEKPVQEEQWLNNFCTHYTVQEKEEREAKERKESERKKPEPREKERKEKEATEKKEIQNIHASNMFSISSSHSFVQEFGKQVEIFPSTPLFIQPNFGGPLPEVKKDNHQISTVIPNIFLHIQPLNNKVLNSRLNFFKEGEYEEAQRGVTKDLNIIVWIAPRNTRVYLVLHPEIDKAKVKYVKFVFDPGGFKVKPMKQ